VAILLTWLATQAPKIESSNRGEAIMNLASYPALVLNADHAPLRAYPLSTWSFEKTMRATLTGRVIVVKEYDTELRSQRFSYRPASVVALKRYVKLPQVAVFNRMNLFLRDDFRCQYCMQQFSPRELTFDHVVPKSQGGLVNWENIVAACAPCNRKKSDRRDMHPKVAPRKPSAYELRTKRPPLKENLHESWLDYIYWGAELEQG
jgi:5-methylcytosine-specific restriction endonuclease McrA